MPVALTFFYRRHGTQRWGLPKNAIHLQSDYCECTSPVLLLFLTLFAFLIFFLPASGASNTSANPPRAALVIGNAEYTSVGVLKNPVNDAHDICRELGALGFKTSCYFDAPTRAQMR